MHKKVAMKRKRLIFPFFLFFLIVGVSHEPYSLTVSGVNEGSRQLPPDEFLSVLDRKAIGWSEQDKLDLAFAIWKEAPKLRIPKNDPDFQTGKDEVSLLLAIIHVESRFNKSAKSRKGAIGLMQIQRKTAQWIAEEFQMDVAYQDLENPEVNVSLAVAYLNYLIGKTGSVQKGLLAYNAGLQGFRKWGGVPKYSKDVKRETKRVSAELLKTI